MAVHIHVDIKIGYVNMYEDLLRKKIIIELKKLVKKAEEIDNDVDSYSEFMREVILNTYGVN